ncbi:mandelate racemase/muconate lactonizing enzyme family protein [Stenotrophomonas tumulicola]|uniref:Mandelate racemase/muconate lactonizing enzyme family protein n=1 Tax=Stenotrophomonas tumulicola TaxID=1685415 RepID=A0A7W3FKX2_9GAMM|nr:mandelate racemase/muconate lactonizing enzyme family protein [Stenotrophomonas tumulicola]MBA8681419.1 mandelate racemase/muconate lactonizing enzyme family protein [Stenotrophomonas tumulicola]
MSQRITRVTAWAVRIPRDVKESLGTAGTPAALGDDAGERYRWATHYRTLYAADHLETVLISVHTDGGLVGWGEAQAPVAPEVTCEIIRTLFAPLLLGEDALAPEAIWDRLYAAMRVRGHTGSFLVDAMAGIDLAIWDLCGKAFAQPVHRLLGGPCRTTLPCYVSGLAGASVGDRVEEARRLVAQGVDAFKVFMAEEPAACLAELDALRQAFGPDIELYVDALWRLDQSSAARFAAALEARDVGWLEAPLMPEDVAGHAALARRTRVPLAVGESYRTCYEVLPFLEQRAVAVLQPDLGRSGLTESRKLAGLAQAFHVPIAPHVSIGLGPQLAAALHLAAATPNFLRLECNPRVQDIANRFLREPLPTGATALAPPQAPGLGIEIDESLIAPFIL